MFAWSLWLSMACCGGGIVCFVLGRRNVPADLEEWQKRLSEDARRLQAVLDLHVAADKAMADDAIARAASARDGLAYTEAIRLVDVAYTVLEAACSDRLLRLKGMSVCVRMAGATILPLAPVSPRIFKLGRLKSLMTVGLATHHFLVSAVERMLLRLLLLRFGYRLTIRALRGGCERLRIDPAALAAWERCHAAVSDWTDGLDPAHV